MIGRRCSEAERLRRHREAMELALSQNISVPDARLRLIDARLVAHAAARRAHFTAPSEAPERPLMWWQREDL